MMAMIEDFNLQPRKCRADMTTAKCLYWRFDDEGKTFFQLNTLGSRQRQHVGTSSQTLRFDENSARKLVKLLKEAFPALSGD